MSPQSDIDASGESIGGNPASQPVGFSGTRVEIEEKKAPYVNGALGLLVCCVICIGASISFIYGADLDESGEPRGMTIIFVSIALIILGLLIMSGLTIVQPGQTKVVQFFGNYVGTIRKSGLLMTYPLTSKKKVSVKVHNFETNELKVNDADGNPVNIASIIVWQVADTAKSTFAVEDHEEFVAVQSEAALRHVSTLYPYDSPDNVTESLRGSTEKVAAELAHEVADRISIAGLEVIEARISSLAYAPEIAQAMLQRQQASAIIAAREKIVEGAVSMVQSALAQLEADNIVDMDDERRANMVSNLLVVLCGDSRATPVVNAGSLYS